MTTHVIGDWRLIAIRGVGPILVGLGTLVWPAVTRLALVLMWLAFALVDVGMLPTLASEVRRETWRFGASRTTARPGSPTGATWATRSKSPS